MTVEPQAATIPAKSSLDLSVTFKPKEEGPVNTTFVCRVGGGGETVCGVTGRLEFSFVTPSPYLMIFQVKRKPTPLTLNIKAHGYAIKVGLERFHGLCLGLPDSPKKDGISR